MNKASVVTALQSLGWRVQTDEVGDKVAFFDLPDRVADIIPDVRGYGGDQQFSTMKSLSTIKFSNACSSIDPGYGNYAPLIRAMKNFRIIVPEILYDHVRQANLVGRDQTPPYVNQPGIQNFDGTQTVRGRSISPNYVEDP